MGDSIKIESINLDVVHNSDIEDKVLTFFLE